MAVDLNNTAPIDPDAPQLQTMLSNLQGNILKGHGRDHTVNIFVKFGADQSRSRQGLASLAGRIVTSAQRQRIEARQYHDWKIPGTLFGGILLTARGYAALGLTPAEINTAFPEPHFRDGMQAHQGDLNDPDPTTWD